jgi:hypothetical protein
MTKAEKWDLFWALTCYLAGATVVVATVVFTAAAWPF